MNLTPITSIITKTYSNQLLKSSLFFQRCLTSYKGLGCIGAERNYIEGTIKSIKLKLAYIFQKSSLEFYTTNMCETLSQIYTCSTQQHFIAFACVHFELQRKGPKLSLNLHLKTTQKNPIYAF
jgi:hypothetical protein